MRRKLLMYQRETEMTILPISEKIEFENKFLIFILIKY
jgi:hypothetical protein